MAHSKGPLLLDGWEKNAAKSGIVYYKLTRMRLQVGMCLLDLTTHV